MEVMEIRVLSVQPLGDQYRAVVRADSPPNAKIHLVLTFPITAQKDIWAAARDGALRYLDVA